MVAARFIGRQAELETLRQSLDRVAQGGTALAFVGGESGAPRDQYTNNTSQKSFYNPYFSADFRNFSTKHAQVDREHITML